MDHLIESGGQYFFLILTFFLVWQSSRYVTSCQKLKESEEKRIVIENIVRAVDQLYSNEGGPKKLARARDLSMTILSGYPIEITSEELTVYIESAVSKVRAENIYYCDED